MKTVKVLKTLGLALALTPLLSLVVLVFITVIGAVDDLITNIQIAGNYWILALVFYLLSLSYLICEPKVRKYIETKKIVNALMIYWKDKLENEGKPQLSKRDAELVEDMLIQRFKIWAWFDEKLWNEQFPEKYPKSLFGIVDKLMEYKEKQV